MAGKTCLRKLHPKRFDIVGLMAASVALLVIGLCLPVLTVRKFWAVNTFSILSGIDNLWKEKYFVLAVLIFFFSVIFPVLKLGALFVIWFVELADHHRKWMLRVLELLGRWSMLDVFVAAVIIVSIKLGALASAKAEPGVYYFGSSILLAMIATGLQDGLARRVK